MNATSLDINVSETLANKTLIVTTILVRWEEEGYSVLVEKVLTFCTYSK